MLLSYMRQRGQGTNQEETMAAVETPDVVPARARRVEVADAAAVALP